MTGELWKTRVLLTALEYLFRMGDRPDVVVHTTISHSGPSLRPWCSHSQLREHLWVCLSRSVRTLSPGVPPFSAVISKPGSSLHETYESWVHVCPKASSEKQSRRWRDSCHFSLIHHPVLPILLSGLHSVLWSYCALAATMNETHETPLLSTWPCAMSWVDLGSWNIWGTESESWPSAQRELTV